jgi:hypothetical protein
MSKEERDEQFYRDTESVAFVKLDDRQLAQLEPLGKRRLVRKGEFIYKAGQRDLGPTVVINGELEMFESRDGHEQILATACSARATLATVESSTRNSAARFLNHHSLSPRNDYRFYRSLRAVKVLLAALRSTLTVLAPREEVRIGSR